MIFDDAVAQRAGELNRIDSRHVDMPSVEDEHHPLGVSIFHDVVDLMAILEFAPHVRVYAKLKPLIVDTGSPDMMKDPPFFPLGRGGVDFLALKAHLDRIGWQGFMVVQLDSSPDLPPKEAARQSAQYIQRTLGVKL